MKKKFSVALRAGFSLIEVMIAMVVLSIGLLGMAMMLTLVMRGNRAVSMENFATNICQRKLEQLKDIPWEDLGQATSLDSLLDQIDFGRTMGHMVQETELNRLGFSWTDQLAQSSGVSDNACFGQSSVLFDDQTDCSKFLRGLGPYIFTRTFVVCKGSDYDVSTGNPPVNTAGDSSVVAGAVRPHTERECLVNPAQADSRTENLGCYTEDIVTAPGPNNPEKKVKVLCTWRTQDGACHALPVSTTLLRRSS